MAFFLEPESDSTTIQTVKPITRSVHHRPHEQKVYTFEEYKTLMQMNLYDSKDKIRQQLKQHLKNTLQNVNDQILDELVANILDPDRNVKLYSNHHSNTDNDAICHEYKTRYHKMKEFDFVLITPVKTKDFDVNEDRIWKKKQYKRMFEEMIEKDCFVTVEVTTHAELEAFIKQFIISIANDALHAYIVSNGHGSSDGLGFNGEEYCYNLDDIIRFANRWFKCVNIQVPLHLPARVLIVFGQCFGHLHNSSANNSRFHVLSFTNPGSCETQFYFEVSGTGDVNSIHFQLETFIDETMKIHRLRDVEMDKPSCLVSARVPPLSPSVSEFSSGLNSINPHPMELSDEVISLTSSRFFISSDSHCDSSSVLVDGRIENMEVEDLAFSDIY